MVLSYLKGIADGLCTMHIGTLMMKIKSLVKLGFLLSFPAFIIDKLLKWGIDNQDYVMVVLIAIIIDHILGTVKHLIARTFSLKRNAVGLAVKLGLVVAMGFLFEGLDVIIKHDSLVKDYILITTRLIVFLYPAGSAFKNSSVLSGGRFPPTAWLEKLKRFEKNLDPKGLTKKEEL